MQDNIDSIRQYLDSCNRPKSWLSKRKSKDLALKFLGRHFEHGKTYSHLELSNLLNSLHSFNDCALLRRELYETRILDRTPDCTKY